MKSNRDRSAFAPPVLFTAIALFVIYQMQFKSVPASDAAFPTLASVILILGSIPLYIQAVKGTMTHTKIVPTEFLRVLFLVAVLYLYVHFLKSVGYIICTFLLCLVLLLYLGYEKKLFGVLYSVIVTGVVYLIFKVLLNVPLAPGILGLM